jgi:transcriptional regulator with XRE-family HTH domain
MKNRILEFLKVENKSSAQFADEIGVQASGISHILSGRNNPSLDFVIKMLNKYNYLSTEWLLFGKGSMYRDSGMRSLFDDNSIINNPDINQTDIKKQSGLNSEQPVNQIIELNIDSSQKSTTDKRKVTKIVWFYDDRSFEEYISG